LLLHIQGFSQVAAHHQLDTLVVSANKINQARKEAPIAISIINTNTITKENATRIDFLLNKVSGVYMPSIGNEQHMMSIRQPISLKGLYLYLEDGMPIRTSGLFSNNALIEINNAFTNRIEIIKGPASALYGAEAIGGVVNFFSKKATEQKEIELLTQMNSLGYKKVDVNIGLPQKKGGWLFNTHWGAQNKGPIDYSDYSKKAISIRHDFTVNEKWKGYQTIQYIDYYAQMTGSVDSIHFADKNFNSLQSFTYRSLSAIRFRQNLTYDWNKNNQTVLNILYRNNRMDQNPTYAIASTSNPLKFKGQTNRNSFHSVVFDFQHILSLPLLQSKLILGGSLDNTKQALKARYIDIVKDAVLGKYSSFSYPIKDSLLTNYKTDIQNAALYVNLVTNFGKHVNMNMSMRYDAFKYIFNNQISSGTPSSRNHFNQFTPKIGLTYHKNNWGGYLNYSKGFVPPQITEIYNAIKVPYLLPQFFNNIETGLWYQSQKWYSEISVYQMDGKNEIVSVRQPDGVNLNQNTGSTQHIGIEYQIKYKMNNAFAFIGTGTHAKHKYTTTLIKGVDVSGNTMNAAPNYWGTLSAEWTPINKLFIIADWQHQSKYFMDETNSTTYPGFNLLNLKINLMHKNITYWLHILNASNTYYSSMATKNFSVKGNAAYSYYIGEPRSIAIGFKWSLISNP
jgi:outer membrane receptor protein involved in Fe transport